MFVKFDQNGAPSEWPVTRSRIKHENPSVGFPLDMSGVNVRDYGFAPYTLSDPAEYDAQWQKAEELTPVEVDGVFVQQWSIVELYSAQEKADMILEQEAAQIESAKAFARSQRDSLLASTDWVVIKAQETGVAMDQALATYRQALRDITDHVNFPYLADEDWPVKPN
jgi:hypothetical protein